MIIYWTALKNSLSPFAYPPFQKKGRRALSISSSSPNFLHLLSFRLPSGTVYNSLIGTNSLQSALSSFHSGKYLYQQLLLSPGSVQNVNLGTSRCAYPAVADQSWRGSRNTDFSLSFYQSLLVSTKDLNSLYFLLAIIFLFLTLTIYNQRRFRQDVL